METSQSTNYEAFTYEPIADQHIRLLRTSSWTKEPSYELFDVSLDSTPEYSTLSYTWDNQPRDQALIVNGTILKVSLNVKTLLPYIFKRDSVHSVWIDGVCINQDDDDEKGVQVPLMEKIYAQARECVVWLGKGNQFTDLAISLIPMLVENLEAHNRVFGSGQYPAELIKRALSPIETGLKFIFSRSWFMRVWTFQEAVLPRIVEVMCGSLSTSFENLVVVVKRLFNSSALRSIDTVASSIDELTWSSDQGMTRLEIIQAARERLFLQATTYDFLDLVYSSLKWPCYNPSDKIYGLLAMADQSLRDEIVVDYKKSSAEVYLDFARCWIPRDPHFKILHMASPSVDQLGLPSWCPNFNSFPVASSFGPYARHAQYHAGFLSGKTTSTLIPVGRRLVQVEGFCVDKVVEVLPCPWERQKHTTAESKSMGTAEVLAWDSKCLEISQRVYKIPDEIPDAHWRTFIANKHVSGEIFTGSGRDLYLLARIMVRQLTSIEIPLSASEKVLAAQELTDAQSTAVTRFCEAFGYAGHGRAFFSTRNNRVGLGSLDTRPGDTVCIFYNAYTPFILRAMEEDVSKQKNHFVGEAYIDGLMYGEAFQDGIERKDELFVLE